VAGHVPVPLGPEDHIELLPAGWQVINSYGVKIGRRTYDSGELNPYRRQHSGIEAENGRWEVRYDPYDISRIWIRNHHQGGWLPTTWKHLRTAPVPFGEQAWTHARQLLAARGSDPATEAEIAAVGCGPARPRRARPRFRTARAGSTAAAPGSRPDPLAALAAGPGTHRGHRCPALAPPASGPVGDDESAGGPGPGADDRTEQPAETETGTPPGQVIPLPLFDACKEAGRW
jgi:putative transposase